MPPFNLSYVLLGVLGGALPDVIRIIRSRFDPSLPAYLGSPNFWLGFVLLLALGGLTAWIGSPENAQGALGMGFAAPELISRLLAQPGGQVQPAAVPVPGIAGKAVATPPGLRAWWTR